MTKSYHILVVEDDQGLNHLICKKLARSGYQMKEARSGAEAMKELKRATYDLILMDYQLPGMDGKTLAGKFNGKGYETPFIAMSGHGNEKVAVEMMKAGAVDYLVKDADFIELLPEKVKKVLGDLETRKALEQSQAALQESEAKSKKILDSMNDPVYICSANREIQYTNPAMLKMTGKTKMQGTCHKAIFQSEKPCAKCPSMKSLLKEDHQKSIVVKMGEETRSFQVSITPVNYMNGTHSRLHILRDVTELVRTRVNVEKNERKYRLLADNSVDTVWQMDQRLHFTYLSPSVTQVWGYEPKEMVGRPLWKYARRREFVKMARYALGALGNHKDFKPLTFETALIHKDGHELPAEVNWNLFRDDDGKVRGLQGNIKEISERIEAQQAIRAQHELLRTLVDNMPDAIYVKDRSGKYLLNNTSHQQELHASSQEEILQKSDFDFFDEEPASEFHRDEQKVVQSGIPMINKEEYVGFRDGTHKWQLTTKVPIRDNQGNIRGIAGINRNISERKEIEDALVKSRYELAFRNSIANAFLTVEKDKIFHQILSMVQKEFNSTYGFFGYINDTEELVCPSMTREIWEECQMEGKTISIPREVWSGIWGRSLLEGKSLIKNEGLVLPEGHIQLRNAMSTPILFQERPIGIICIGNKPGKYHESEKDMLEATCNYLSPILHAFLNEEQAKEAKENAFLELNIAKEKAVESDKLKTAFLLNLSHELRTPLNAIMGFSKLIVEKNRDREGNVFFAEQVDSAGNDLIKTIEDTMEMAQLQSGQVQVDTTTSVIGNTLDLIRKEYEKKYAARYPDIAFSILDESGGSEVCTDHDKLKKALMKLLDNAMKFTSSGEVVVGAHANGADVMDIYVKDTGIGIPKEKHEAVFEKFTKLEDQQTLYRGNGLGLSICKGLIDRIGGAISIESAPGKGTKMKISLPLQKET